MYIYARTTTDNQQATTGAPSSTGPTWLGGRDGAKKFT